jgi:PTS system galactitol-specific IIA component
MGLNLKIKQNFVQTDILVQDQQELFAILTKPLLDDQIVKPIFLEKVLERESQFPTGLPLREIGAAIPHTDAEHVYENAISIGVLSEPVPFQVMGSPDKSVDVKIVFLLALSNAEKHLTILQKVISFIQNEESLHFILNHSNKEVYEYIIKHFD